MRNAAIPGLVFHLESDALCSRIQDVIKLSNKVIS